MSLPEFYATTRWTLRYWAFGLLYTIVRFRHIGLDIGTGGRAIDVPALWGGTVVRVVKTNTMGFVIILDTGLPGARRYHSYCHMSGERLPDEGDKIRQGGRVGRLAEGPKTLKLSAIDFPGTLWNGVHLHLVLSSHIAGAYTKGTGATYANPETLIIEVIAKLADPKPASGSALRAPYISKLALGNLYVYAGRSRTSKRLTRIPRGTVVKTSNVIAGFTYVSFGRFRGWAVSSRLLKRFRTTTADLNLRSSRTTAKRNVITTIPKGTQLTILATSGSWRKTTYDGRTGWVSAEFLK